MSLKHGISHSFFGLAQALRVLRSPFVMAPLVWVLSSCDVGTSAAAPEGSCESPEQPGGSWRPIPDSGFGIRMVGFTYAWTGSELLVLGHPTQQDAEGRPLTAAAYAPESGTWRDVSAHGVLEGGGRAASVWTGTEWIVWGGQGVGEPEAGKKYRVLSEGARFDPVSGEWTALAESPLGGRFGHLALWTGREMLVWGGFDEDGALGAEDLHGAAYDPEHDSWRVISHAGAPRVNLLPVWTGEHMVLWAALPNQTHAARYDPERDVWASISTSGAPTPSGGALWTGKEVLAWAFAANTWARYKAGAYEPLTDTWRLLSTEGAPPSTREVWTGSRVLTWGDPGGCELVGSYDPVADEWIRLGGGGPTPRAEPAMVWTGSSLIVLGGHGGESGAEIFSDGGEFVLDEP